MQYITTSSYGRLIGTIPDLQADKIFFDCVSARLAELEKQYAIREKLDNSAASQKRYVSLMEDCFKTIISETGKFDLFSDVPDHYHRPMGRYILKDDANRWNYIIDVFATLDVKLEISKTKRFFLTHLPWKFTSVTNEEFVPKVKYQYRVWNTPVSYYLFDAYDAEMNVEYSSRVERARQLFGLPKIYDPKELKCYERIDYDIRRAIFNEVADVFQSRSSGKGECVS